MNAVSETWRAVPSLPGYEASDTGNIRGPRGLRKLKRHMHGYLVFGVATPSGRSRNVYVARCVCEAFHGPPPPRAQVDHIDRVRDNNVPSNLRWVSKDENLRHRRLRRGSASPQAKLTEADVCAIRASRASSQQLADIYSVSPRTIRDARCGICWRHVDA